MRSRTRSTGLRKATHSDLEAQGVLTAYSLCIQVLEALGLRPGSVVLDFGCSWGYGSSQLSRAGFDVYSYEISDPRARYVAETSNCKTLESTKSYPRKVDCFFSAHVIEHLSNLNIFWDAALDVLAPYGLIVCSCLNGHPDREHMCRTRYHNICGKMHPLYISPQYAREITSRKD